MTIVLLVMTGGHEYNPNLYLTIVLDSHDYNPPSHDHV